MDGRKGCCLGVESKVVLQSILTYVFLVFLLPKGITNEMVGEQATWSKLGDDVLRQYLHS